jgi:hypothetical protein
MSNEVLGRHWDDLKQIPGVLNAAVASKFKAGADTGVEAIVLYVEKKKPCTELPGEHCIPIEIEGIPTDVIEISPQTWTAGKTEISQRDPEEQLRMLGASKPIPPSVKPMITKSTFSAVSDLSAKWANPERRNQGSCGSCVGNGSINCVEGKYRIQANLPGDILRLSVDNAFFCSGGSCSGGQDVSVQLDWLKANYVCTETCQPTKNVDIACNQGRCATPWINAKKLSAWNIIADTEQMKALLDGEPLVVVMAVHQSFFNYQSGIYKSLGPQDPVVGYHCICNWGHNEPEGYWGPVENSWGDSWGEKGFFRITFGDSEIDQQMWQVVVDLNPIPAPAPTPTPQPAGNCILDLFRKVKMERVQSKVVKS